MAGDGLDGDNAKLPPHCSELTVYRLIVKIDWFSEFLLREQQTNFSIPAQGLLLLASSPPCRMNGLLVYLEAFEAWRRASKGQAGLSAFLIVFGSRQSGGQNTFLPLTLMY